MARWIETVEALRSVADEIGRGPLALDTEADSFHHYREKTCLVQLSFGGEDVLVDPLCGVPLDALGPPLGDPGVRTILHGADYDLRLLNRDHGLRVRGVFDTMVAARLVGERSFGLAALLERHFAVRLDKRFQRADWSLRPLPPALEVYAAMDTHHLEALADVLEGRLVELGRAEWAAEEFRRIEEDPREEAAAAEEPFRRVKGAAHLDRRALAVLRELQALRDRAARRRDVPVFRVLGDDTLCALAGAQPGTAQEVAATRGVPRGWAGSGGVEAILDAVRDGLAVPEGELPERSVRKVRLKDPQAEARLRRACQVRDHLAATLGLEPPVLASRGLLESLMQQLDLGFDPDPLRVPALRRWQAGLLGPTIETLGEG